MAVSPWARGVMTARICPSEPFEVAIVSVLKRAGDFRLTVQHKHLGHPHGLCEAEVYELQRWTEVVDVLLAALDGVRPGSVAAGWEQLELFSS